MQQLFYIFLLFHILFSTLKSEEKEPEYDSLHIKEEILIIGKHSNISDFIGASTKINLMKHEELSQRSVSELLQYSPGTYIRDYGGEGGMKTISIRGAGASESAVLLNGIPVNSSGSGSFDFSTLPTSIFSDLTVTRGGASAYYGSNAVSGAVNMTIKPHNNRQTKINATISSFRTYKVSVFHSDIVAKSPYLLSISYNNSKGNFPFEYNDFGTRKTYERKNGDFESFSLVFNDVIDFSNIILSTTILTAFSNRGVPGAVIQGKPENIFARLSDKNFYIFNSASISLDSVSGIDISTMIKYNELSYKDNYHININGKSDNDFYESSAILKADYYNNNSNLSDNLSFQLKYDFLDGDMLQDNTINNNTINNSTINSIMRLSASLYGARVYKINHNKNIFNIISAMRINYTSDMGFFVSPLITLDYDFATLPIQTNISYTYNYRNPTFNEMYYLNYGNVDLNPEFSHSINWEFTYYFLEDFKFVSNVFYLDTKDKIISVPRSPVVWSAENIGRAVSTGFEGELLLEMFDDRFILSVAYTYQNVRDESLHSINQGKLLIYTPQEIISAYTIYKNKYFNTGGSFRYSSFRYSLPENTYKSILPTNYICNVFISKAININNKSIDIRCGIDNIFNHRYELINNYPIEGRKYYLSVFYK